MRDGLIARAVVRHQYTLKSQHAARSSRKGHGIVEGKNIAATADRPPLILYETKIMQKYLSFSSVDPDVLRR